MVKIFSIGPGNESLEQFMERLKKQKIELLVDLRKTPGPFGTFPIQRKHRIINWKSERQDSRFDVL